MSIIVFIFVLLFFNLGATGYLIYKSQQPLSVQHTGKWYGEISTEEITPSLWITRDESLEAYQIINTQGEISVEKITPYLWITLDEPLEAYRITNVQKVILDVLANKISIIKQDRKTFINFFEYSETWYYWPTDLNIGMITEAANLSIPITLEFGIAKYTYVKGGWFLVIEMVTIKTDQ